MATDNHDDHDDLLDGPVPAPDREASASERAHAKAFAELVDKTIAGRTPPALSHDDRALLEVATVIRAASGNMQLAATKQRSLVEDALRQAIGGVSPGASLGTTPIQSARRRWLPWTIAATSTAIAAAAVLALWLRPGGAGGAGGAGGPSAPTAQRQVPTEQRSRASDALIGPIARDHAGDASARIDAIFADRLDGYRAEIYGGLR